MLNQFLNIKKNRKNKLTEKIERNGGFLVSVRVSRMNNPAEERLAVVLVGEGVGEDGEGLEPPIVGLGFVGLRGIAKLSASEEPLKFWSWITFVAFAVNLLSLKWVGK
jgi:hypothetical protein